VADKLAKLARRLGAVLQNGGDQIFATPAEQAD